MTSFIGLMLIGVAVVLAAGAGCSLEKYQRRPNEQDAKSTVRTGSVAALSPGDTGGDHAG